MASSELGAGAFKGRRCCPRWRCWLSQLWDEMSSQ